MSRIQITQDSVIGELILDNPKTLNALSQADIQAIKSGLDAHEANPDVRAIIIRSTSHKAFCAGGDMKHIRELALAGEVDKIHGYFQNEYALNLAIARCSKPYIALLDGIAMGGGLGISIHGKYRIVTERSMLAMPETRIGFFPDVGASYFLPRLPHRAGFWLGLTSMAVHGQEAVAVGLATHLINSEKLESLRDTIRESLQQLPGPDDATLYQCVTDSIESAAEQVNKQDFQACLEQRELWFANSDLSIIRDKLQGAVNAGHEDAAHLLELFNAGSPHAMQLTLQLLADAQGKSLEQCLQLELALSSKTALHADCIEGIRAVLVDKDRKPLWQSAER